MALLAVQVALSLAILPSAMELTWGIFRPSILGPSFAIEEFLGPDVYITIDVDYFDPSLVPATGTPEPGGGQWYPTLRLLERVFAERHVVGVDVVELAPIPGFVAPDFLVAKLVYKLIAYHQRGRAPGSRRR